MTEADDKRMKQLVPRQRNIIQRIFLGSYLEVPMAAYLSGDIKRTGIQYLYVNLLFN